MCFSKRVGTRDIVQYFNVSQRVGTRCIVQCLGVFLKRELVHFILSNILEYLSERVDTLVYCPVSWCVLRADKNFVVQYAISFVL